MISTRSITRLLAASALGLVSTAADGQQGTAVPRVRVAVGALVESAELARLAGLASLSSLASLGSLAQFAEVKELKALAARPTIVDLSGLSAFGYSSATALADVGTATRPGRWSTSWTFDQAIDSLYRQARERMNRGQYKQAAELFMEVARRAGKQPLAGDALYWNAYSLFRDGGTPALNDALESLTRLTRDFPAASALGDARSLRVRVCGELAKRGDEKCAAEVAEIARPERPERPERTERPERPERPERTTRTSVSSQDCPRDDEDDERVAALNALLQMDSERALPILEKVLARRDKCSAALRRKAVFLVSQKGDARAADILMGAVRNDPDGEVREQAVFWLGQTRDERAVELLQEILQKETNDEVLDKAVFALSQHRSERASTILRDLAQRDGASLKVREQAIFWLGQQSGNNNGDLLKNLYRRVKEEELKEKIIFSISQNRASDNARWLLDVALDGKEGLEMRKKALFWAGQSRGVSMDDLATLYKSVDDRELREQVIFVYSQRRDPAAVDKLMDIARTDKDVELRKKAIFWLSQSRDPRAVKFLEEIIGR